MIFAKPLTLILSLPFLGAVALACLPSAGRKVVKITALLSSLSAFLISVLLFLRFDSSSAEMQFVDQLAWIRVGGFQIDYHVGIDGISLLLVLLTTLLVPLVVVASWRLQRHLKSYLICLLLLEVGMLGVFISLDLILFYVFWEVMLIPMYLLIGIWGGSRRIYAAVKFFLYTMAGSMMMLAAIIALYFINNGSNFNWVEISAGLANQSLAITPLAEKLLFLAFFLAFAIKVPLFPFHTWLPDAHVEAPTGGSVILAGVLLKMGTYGLLRFCLPLFPLASVAFAPWISILAVIGILYGALVAMVQPDIKKLVAYSSVSHLGIVVLGIFSFNLIALEGAALQMINHGISTGALFLLVGMIYDRRHTHQIADFGGLAHRMPHFTALFLIMTLSSIGLPGLNGFVGEYLVLQGTFLASWGLAAVAATAMIWAAVYMLWMFQRVFLGELRHRENRRLHDLTFRETLVLLPLVVLAFWIGLRSPTFVRPLEPSIAKIVERVETVRANHIFGMNKLGQ